MYEDYRTELVSELVKDFAPEEVRKILKDVDKVSAKYSFETHETALAPTGANEEIIRQYLACRSVEGMSKNSVKVKFSILRLFSREISKSLTDVSTNDIRTWLYYCMGRVSDRTCDFYRITLNALFVWMKSEGLIENNPCEKIKKIKYAEKKRSALSESGLEKMRMACKTDKEKALIEFLYSTGCRIDELSNAKISDLDLERGTVRLLGKGSKYRYSYISAKCKLYLEQYLESRKGESEYIFCRNAAQTRHAD